MIRSGNSLPDQISSRLGLQKQSAEWAAACCGGYVLPSGAVGIRLDVVFNKLEQILERRRVRKIREQIARELAELEAARKKAGQ